MRSLDNTDCTRYNSEYGTEILREKFILKGGITNYGEINSTIGQILIIINNIVIPVLWLALGILLIAKLITFLLNKFEIKTYFAIFGFIFSSLIVIFFKNNITFNIIEFIIGIVLMVVGFLVSYYIANFNKEEEEVA